jgi:hypothetical protein
MGLALPPGTTLTLETKYFPPMTVDLSGQTPPSTSGQVAGIATALLVKVVKPKLTVKFAGATISTWKPAGEPGENQWKATRIVLAVAVGLLAFRLVKLVL